MVPNPAHQLSSGCYAISLKGHIPLRCAPGTMTRTVGTPIKCYRRKETEIGFPDYIEKTETGAIGRALAMCGYGTLQAPGFDEQDRLVDTTVESLIGNDVI